ncbi:CocE/NonD family hydrolase [Panacibacter ginsenosidivorans]|uniref:CocE/NonD family hydrolase n=1 Tax=Panacibacter ginsenosidivorans TaxID=1813871 RepID=A0A5B8VB33_9BACT|nr:CocE/NonD family hydrolase [Panacibacter ginsenosidivorans]QEC68680.1 CocE/NonD family hydrolase [Panacibacter ginsenosidivorans]
MKPVQFILIFCLISFVSCAQQTNIEYTKIERMIPMRDGIKLFTAIYIPKNASEKLPILMERTPYSCAPYGESNYRNRLGPNALFKNEPYIYVYQDVRGRHMSEGDFQEMTPAIDNKKSNKDVDESSDTYDTVDWLLKNIDNNNGKVGIYGISYPGFYATASLPNAHPAIVAVSPQAPVTDEFEGDDAYHRGAFYLMDNFDFMNFFDSPRNSPRKEDPFISDKINIEDAYQFYLQMGALSNYNAKYFENKSKIWNEYLEHNTNDSYWQQRNIRTHLKNIKPATLLVGGFFDAEDMFGALNTYQAIEKQNTGNDNKLVMGPWTHGAWESSNWSKFVSYDFSSNTSTYFQQLEYDFFNSHLKGKGAFNAGEATIFFTGSNEWKTFAQWPPKEAVQTKWFLNEQHGLAINTTATKGFDEYTSDPANPVPYIDKKAGERLSEYMAADQRFATKRKDVLYYESPVLENDITLSGPLTASLSVSMTGTDADFIIKVIDVLPDTAQTQQLVRAEVLRGKFRNSFEKPEPFEPNKITPVKLVLNDVAHTFKKGHKIMVQVQSSWFPLVDRNPQQFMNIPAAKDSDFKKSDIKIYHDSQHPSYIECLQLK